MDPFVATMLLLVIEFGLMLYAISLSRPDGDRWLITLLLINFVMLFYAGAGLEVQDMHTAVLRVPVSSVIYGLVCPITAVLAARFGLPEGIRAVRSVRRGALLTVLLGGILKMAEVEKMAVSNLARTIAVVVPCFVIFMLSQKITMLVHEYRKQHFSCLARYAISVILSGFCAAGILGSSELYSRIDLPTDQVLVYVSVFYVIGVMAMPLVLYASQVRQEEKNKYTRHSHNTVNA